MQLLSHALETGFFCLDPLRATLPQQDGGGVGWGGEGGFLASKTKDLFLPFKEWNQGLRKCLEMLGKGCMTPQATHPAIYFTYSLSG